MFNRVTFYICLFQVKTLQFSGYRWFLTIILVFCLLFCTYIPTIHSFKYGILVGTWNYKILCLNYSIFIDSSPFTTYEMIFMKHLKKITRIILKWFMIKLKLVLNTKWNPPYYTLMIQIDWMAERHHDNQQYQLDLLFKLTLI